MSKATILFADNKPTAVQSWMEKLAEDGYRVEPARTYEEALHKLKTESFKLAILDLRMRNDEHKDDFSGLDLAREIDPMIPKIILTAYPSYEALSEAIKPRIDHLPLAVEFVLKRDGYDRLRSAIDRALGEDLQWLQQMQETLQGAGKILRDDHREAQKQARNNAVAAFLMAPLGAAVAFYAILTGVQYQQDAWAGVLVGAVIEAMSYLFFRRVDAANRRADEYHREWVQNHHFDVLLRAADCITHKETRERCRCQILSSARRTWLADHPVSPVVQPAPAHLPQVSQ